MRRIIILAAIAAIAFSCNRIEESSLVVSDSSFRATIAETKTTLVDDVKTEWVAADAISVFGTEGTNYWLSTTEGGATATFRPGDQSVEEGLVASAPYALYPYDSDASISGTSISTEIAKEQYAVAGNFPSNQKPLLIAKSDASGNLSFWHATAVLKFELTDSDIEYIYIEGNNSEKLTGNYVISYESGNVTTQVDGDWTETTALLKNEDGSALDLGTYYLVMAPALFEGGFTMKWGPDKDGYNAYRYTGKQIEAKAGHILNLGTLKYWEDDSTAPEITAFSEYNISLAAGNSKTITVSASDNAELASITCRLYTTDWSSILDEESFPVSGTVASADYTLDYAVTGSYLFVAYATDAAGNTSSWWNTSVTITESSEDTTPPSVTLKSSVSATVGETYTLVVNFADESGISTCYPKVCVESGDWNVYPAIVGSLPSGYWANASGNWGTTVSGTDFDFTLDLSFPTAGEYNVWVYEVISDSAGNSTSSSLSLGSITVSGSAE
ncbi:MAG: hypothetical protein ACI4TM_00275 [Candidatus Cryptobacteroides sp.]